jgi:hypothetical protein
MSRNWALREVMREEEEGREGRRGEKEADDEANGLG